MQWWGVGRAFRAPRCDLSRATGLAALLLGTTLAGCSSHAPATGRIIPVGAATIAFESIDGPPPAVFQKLVTTLNDEAAARQLPVVSRAEHATYRVRGYVSAMVDRRKVSFAWVWDVYDADKRRALRIAGEEPADSRPRDAWSAADAAVLRRMAKRGMAEIAAFLGSPPALPEPGEPEPTPPPAQAVALAARP
jgi:hypothetical protein